MKPFHPRLRPELLDDLADAFAWYEQKAEGVGQALVRAFFAAVAQATRQPLLLRQVHGSFRRVLLRRYPYFLYYFVEADEVVFLLLWHGRRHPQTARRILSKRRKAKT